MEGLRKTAKKSLILWTESQSEAGCVALVPSHRSVLVYLLIYSTIHEVGAVVAVLTVGLELCKELPDSGPRFESQYPRYKRDSVSTVRILDGYATA
jgi:hypothetical protein